MPSAEKSSPSPFEYRLADWFRHYAFRARRSEQVEATTLHREIAQMFERDYPDPLQREYMHRRFVAAMTYLDRHIQDFDVERIAIVGSQESGDVVSNHLVTVVYTVYCRVPDGRVDEDFPARHVLNLARQFSSLKS